VQIAESCSTVPLRASPSRRRAHGSASGHNPDLSTGLECPFAAHDAEPIPIKPIIGSAEQRPLGSAFTTETLDEFIRESIKKFPQPSPRPAGGVREGSAKLPVDPQVLQKDEHTNRSKTQTSDGPSFLSKPDKP
jgi:hypothetical protein